MNASFVLFYILISVCPLFFVNAYVTFDVPDDKLAIDPNLFEDALDSELCEEQLQFIRSDPELLFAFVDAGARTPRGVLVGNFLDLGNYYQCLSINQDIQNSTVEGKYCLVDLPLDQNIEWPSLPELPDWPDIPWPDLPWPELNPKTRLLKNETIQRLQDFNKRKTAINAFIGSSLQSNRIAEGSALSGLTFSLAFCIPKLCSTKQFFDTLLSVEGLEVRERFCRLPNDKPWVAADYVFIAVFSFLGILLILSTAYDIQYNVYQQRDPKKINKLYQSFSVYNNTRRLFSYTPVPGSLECLDGIRSFAMMWVIIGHTFGSQLASNIMANPLDTMNYIMSLKAIWVTSAPITVDTFFALSGLLLVYTSAGKMTGMKLLRNLHLFYLNRILRIIPVLAAMILVTASFLNWVTDGPYWEVFGNDMQKCRVSWWSTLLHVQNFVNPTNMCLSHAWYLAIDLQLYFISPIILFWILGRKRVVAWIALIGSLIIVLAASAIYNFIMEFPPGSITPTRLDEQLYYQRYYYLNTLTRASPFFVGLIFGYVLHLNRGRKVVISKISAAILWFSSFVIISAIMYSTYPIMQLDWDNQFADSMINTLIRPGWALAIGWMTFACVHGYGGKNPYKNKISAAILWSSSFVIISAIMYSTYPIMQLDWDNQFADSMINTLIRPGWALAIGWMTFACVHGYGGPINWILSLRAWKVLGRLSYAMYIVHYPLIFLINATPVAPVYFSVHFSLFKYLSDFLLAVIVAFLMTLMVESPCSVLVKHFMGGGPRRPPPVKIAENNLNEIDDKKLDINSKL